MNIFITPDVSGNLAYKFKAILLHLAVIVNKRGTNQITFLQRNFYITSCVCLCVSECVCVCVCMCVCVHVCVCFPSNYLFVAWHDTVRCRHRLGQLSFGKCRLHEITDFSWRTSSCWRCTMFGRISFFSFLYSSKSVHATSESHCYAVNISCCQSSITKLHRPYTLLDASDPSTSLSCRWAFSWFFYKLP